MGDLQTTSAKWSLTGQQVHADISWLHTDGKLVLPNFSGCKRRTSFITNSAYLVTITVFPSKQNQFILVRVRGQGHITSETKENTF